MVGAILHMLDVFVELRAPKEQRGKYAYRLVLRRKPELTLGGEEINHGEVLKQDQLLLRL